MAESGPVDPVFMALYFKRIRKYVESSLKKGFVYMDFKHVVGFGKDRHRKIPKIRLIKCSKSWIWDQYPPENMNGFLLIWYQYLYQQMNGIFKFVLDFYFSCFIYGFLILFSAN